MLDNFHFLEPLWLLVLIPLALIFWLVNRRSKNDSGWDEVIDSHLLSVLLKDNVQKPGRSFSALLMLAWLISVLALANPSWEKRTVPIFQTDLSRVIVLDLSRSMDIPDVKPSRLARAKFKIEDILSKTTEGQTGLVVFAGDAFTAAPLTRDVGTIRALLPALNTQIMPVQGSRADLGLLKAQALLEQAGVAQGQVLLIADGAETQSALKAAKQLQQKDHTVSVLSVGTPLGAAIPDLRDHGRLIVVKLHEKTLKAIATQGGGRHSLITTDSTDIDYLSTSINAKMNKAADKAAQTGDNQHEDWKSEGPLLILLLLPLAAIAFRRGWLLSISLLVILLGQPQPVMAVSWQWENRWQRQDQQADQALQAGNYEQAQQLSQDPLRRGTAAYKNGQYQQALQDFEKAKGADADYNKGNALAQLNQYEAAIKAYEQALQQQPGMLDAIQNKETVEALLKQQQDKKQSPENKQKQQNQDKSPDKNPDKNQKQDNESQQNSPETGSEDSKDDSEKDKNIGTDKNQNKGKDKEQQKDNQFANANQQQEDEDKQKKPSEDEPTRKPNEAEQDKQSTKKADQSPTAQQQAISNEQTNPQPAKALSSEEKIAAEQWLRRIPDEPGELLKRKFKYQYKRRDQPVDTGSGTPW